MNCHLHDRPLQCFARALTGTVDFHKAATQLSIRSAYRYAEASPQYQQARRKGHGMKSIKVVSCSAGRYSPEYINSALADA